MANIKYTKELLSPIVARNYSVAGVLRELGLKPVGGNSSHISKRIKSFGIDTSHFTGQGWNKGRQARNRITDEQILAMLSLGEELNPRIKTKFLRRAMILSGIEEVCICGTSTEWMGNLIVLEVDHVNGNHWDNRIENLRFLCPNCHSQQPTGRPWKNSK